MRDDAWDGRAAMAAGVAKTGFALAKLAHRSGTSLPGEWAMKVDPKIATKLLAGQNLVIVTGTNGKTTTVKALSQLLDGRRPVLYNKTGANLIYGLISLLLAHHKDLTQADPSKRPWIVFEMDEAHFARYAKDLHPTLVLLTNLYEDQTDRYGSLRQLSQLILGGLLEARPPFTVFCGDDPASMTIARSYEEGLGKAVHENKGQGVESLGQDGGMKADKSSPQVVYFAAKSQGFQDEAAALSATFDGTCPSCGAPLSYSEVTLADLGKYSCPACGLANPPASLSFTWKTGVPLSMTFAYQGPGQEGQELQRRQERQKAQGLQEGLPTQELAQTELSLPGKYNAYNLAGALLAAKSLLPEEPLQTLAVKLAGVTAPFGRLEHFSLEGREFCMILAKNPAGLREALATAFADPHFAGLLLVMNQAESDGRDASWLRQVDLGEFWHPEAIPSFPLVLGGEALEDLEASVKASQAAQDQWIQCPRFQSIPEAWDAFVKEIVQKTGSAQEDDLFYLIPNYTAMMQLRRHLGDLYGVKAFWE